MKYQHRLLALLFILIIACPSCNDDDTLQADCENFKERIDDQVFKTFLSINEIDRPVSSQMIVKSSIKFRDEVLTIRVFDGADQTLYSNSHNTGCSLVEGSIISIDILNDEGNRIGDISGERENQSILHYSLEIAPNTYIEIAILDD